MDIKEKIRLFHAYALTTNVGLYNEDSMTAQKLMIESAKKIKECLEMVSVLSEGIENIYNFLKINYNEENEELELSIGEKITNLKSQVNSSYVCIYNEDALTSGELAGRTAQATNECLKAVNMLCDLVEEINEFVTLNYVNSDEMIVVGGES